MTSFDAPAQIWNQELSQKRLKRTGLDYERYQPRPAHIRASGDCVIRGICWFFPELTYEQIHQELQEMTNRMDGKRASNILNRGVCCRIIRRWMEAHGWKWTESKGDLKPYERKTAGGYTIKGTIRKRRLFKADNIPATALVLTSEHCVAVEDRICLDSWDSRGDRSPYLEGYFTKA